MLPLSLRVVGHTHEPAASPSRCKPAAHRRAADTRQYAAVVRPALYDPMPTAAVLAALDDDREPGRADLKAATRHLARLLAARHPGRSVEVRVPPYAAVQCLAGVRHTRGTPPATVEVEPVAFVQLCTGRLTWADAVRDGRVRASGERSDLSALLPLIT